MSFRALIVSAALAVAALSAAPAALAAIPIIDISAMSGAGQQVTLAAGTYDVDFVDNTLVSGFAGTGWSFWGGTTGNCTAQGGVCTAGYFNLFNVENVTNTAASFQVIKNLPVASNANPLGSAYGYSMYNTFAEALAAYNAGVDVIGGAGVASANPTLRLTLAAPTTLRFYIDDIIYTDNGNGGVSLLLTAVPEPATWGLMILGFGGMGVALRRRRQVALAA